MGDYFGFKQYPGRLYYEAGKTDIRRAAAAGILKSMHRKGLITDERLEAAMVLLRQSGGGL